ncbi:hypothetical protein VUJ46_04305 [Chryseobacterium sp. MYb264]|uniref:hypothetical protein n=1 Tax=Chryseobacterium sp. MYb264 TaxID=2745153 RepID=UPI002E160120|nr:hypothetical protein VUJ46_04305 [Chryseobacterium sp. MYb264]
MTVVPSLVSDIVLASEKDANPSAYNLQPEITEADLISKLDTLRKSLRLIDTQITTYTYDPLIGVRSITPPSGVREVYVYDSANRLMEIREQNQTGKLLKEFKYNYKN